MDLGLRSSSFEETQHFDDDVSESERAYLQSNYDRIFSPPDKSKPRFTMEMNDSIESSISTFDGNEFDLLPIIEESGKKYTSFTSLINQQLKDQPIYTNGRSPTLSINQYSIARLKLNSQIHKGLKRGIGVIDGRAVFSLQKDLSSPSRSSSPRKDLQDGFGSTLTGFPSHSTTTNPYFSSMDSPGELSRDRDPLLLPMPVLGAAAFNRLNKQRQHQHQHGSRNRSKASVRLKGHDLTMIYGTTGVSATLSLGAKEREQEREKDRASRTTLSLAPIRLLPAPTSSTHSPSHSPAPVRSHHHHLHSQAFSPKAIAQSTSPYLAPMKPRPAVFSIDPGEDARAGTQVISPQSTPHKPAKKAAAGHRSP